MTDDVDWQALLVVGLAFFVFLFGAGYLAKSVVEGLINLFSWGGSDD